MRIWQSTAGDLVHFAQMSGTVFAILTGAAVTFLLFVRGLKTLQCRRHLPEQLIVTFRRIGFWVMLVATVLLLLQVFGILHSVIAAVTGVLALLAIGFVAVWSVLSNTLCSLILMVIRPFRVGDTLAFPPDDLRGRVVNFNLIFTTLQTEDDLFLQVPNNMFFQRPIVRAVGQWKIGLADQLYESKNATGKLEPRNDEDGGSRKAA